MATSTVYVLDSNVLIEAKRRYYAFDVCPGFWQALVWQHSQGAIVSVDRVKWELEGHTDELSDWACSDMPSECFCETDADEVLAAYAEVIRWGMAQGQFSAEAKADFARLENADAWVIALAKVIGGTVTTHEKADPNVRRRIPIPNVCDALGVQFIDTFDMLRSLATQFFWQPPAA